MFKNKKALSSVLAILIALTLIAGSTYAWFVEDGDGGGGTVTVGTLKLDMNLWDIPDLADVQADLDAAFVPAKFVYSGGVLGVYSGVLGVFEPWYIQPGVNFGVGTAYPVDLGYIENTGNLPALLKLSDAGLTVDGMADTKILAKLTIPNTVDNYVAFDNGEAMLYNVGGDYYLGLNPGAKISAGVMVDMTTNGATIGGNYYNSIIDVNYRSLRYTQLAVPAAYQAVFGIAGDVDDYNMAIDLFNFLFGADAIFVGGADFVL